MAISLYPHQEEAISKLKSGSVLVADVGTGKSRTALAYFYIRECDGALRINGKGEDKPMRRPRDLYIICPAKKRDSHEWEDEASFFDFSQIDIHVDSWNNIKKYANVNSSFFIFDEQRLIGSGAWVKAFLKLAQRNHWILLTGTPADTWSDLIPVFVANGFYKNKSEFLKRHAVFNRFSKFPKIDRYVETKRLERLRDLVYVKMEFAKIAEQHHVNVMCDYDKKLYLQVWKDRWDPYDNKPIRETGKLCYLMRRVVNEDPSRLTNALEILDEHPKVIIFYNYTYELNTLRDALNAIGVPYNEWNGEIHEPVPEGERWCYLVQYTAGAEAWNCTTTDTVIFYSQNYSYRIMIQSAGRIDRLNTPYTDLYYYHLKSHAPIDIAIARAIQQKRKFNESAFVGSYKKHRL